MTTPKFRSGQLVRLVPARYGAKAVGTFHVVRPMPEEHGIRQYRIKSTMDGHERVVVENELA
jgi:hypothetical protein